MKGRPEAQQIAEAIIPAKSSKELPKIGDPETEPTSPNSRSQPDVGPQTRWEQLHVRLSKTRGPQN